MSVETTLEATRDVLARTIGAGQSACYRTVAGAAMFVDDLGRHKQLPGNLLASGLYGGVVVGPVVVMTLAETFDDSDQPDLADSARAAACTRCHGTGVNTEAAWSRLCSACLATGVSPSHLVPTQ